MVEGGEAGGGVGCVICFAFWDVRVIIFENIKEWNTRHNHSLISPGDPDSSRSLGCFDTGESFFRDAGNNLWHWRSSIF